MDNRTSKQNYYLDIADAVLERFESVLGLDRLYAALYLPEANVRRDNRAQ